MNKRRKVFLASTVVVVLIIIIGISLYAQAPPTTQQSSTPEDLPLMETPPNLLVIPEVPLGTIAILLACFFALVISQMKPQAKLR